MVSSVAPWPDRPAPRTGIRRRSRPFVIAALVGLFALLSIDCLNLIQSNAWTDLSQAPHMAAAFSRAPNGDGSRAARSGETGAAAPWPVPSLFVVVVVAWLLTDRVQIVHGPGARRRERERAPPASPVRPGVA